MLRRTLLLLVTAVLVASGCVQAGPDEPIPIAAQVSELAEPTTVPTTSAPTPTPAASQSEPPEAPLVATEPTPRATSGNGVSEDELEQPPIWLSPTSGQPVRSVDFHNEFRYDYGYGAVVVADGAADVGELGSPEYVRFAVTGVTYGDLTGDGIDEAVVSTWFNTGGTGQFTQATIFGAADDRLVELGRTAVGDRAFGGLLDATVRGGVLEIDVWAVGESGGACCPDRVETHRYQFDQDELVSSTTSPQTRGYGILTPIPGELTLDDWEYGLVVSGVLSQPDDSVIIKGQPGTTLVLWSTDLVPSTTIALTDESTDSTIRAQIGTTVTLPPSGQLRLRVHKSIGDAIGPRGEQVRQPQEVYTLEIMRDDLAAVLIGSAQRPPRVIGAGRPMAISADGDSLLIADLSAEGGRACEGEFLEDFWLRSIDDSVRTSAGESPTRWVGRFVANDSWAVWVDWCHGQTRVLAGSRSASGEINAARELPAEVGFSDLTQIEDDDTVWIHTETSSGQTWSQRFDLDSARLLDTIPEPEPLGDQHDPGPTWSEAEGGWAIPVDGAVQIDRTIPRDATVHPDVVIDENRGVVFVGVLIADLRWSTVAVPLDSGPLDSGPLDSGPLNAGGSVRDESPSPWEALAPVRPHRVVPIVSLPAIDSWLVWESAHVDICAPGRFAVVDAWGKSTPTTLESLAPPEFGPYFEDGWLAMTEGGWPCGLPNRPVVAQFAEDGTVTRFVRSPLPVLDGFWLSDPQPAEGEAIRLQFASQPDAILEFDNRRISVDGATERAVRISDQEWQFDLELLDGWTAVIGAFADDPAAHGGVVLSHTSGAVISAHGRDDAQTLTNGYDPFGVAASAGQEPRPLLADTFEAGESDFIATQLPGLEVRTADERLTTARNPRFGTLITHRYEGLQRWFVLHAWVPDEAPSEVLAAAERMLASVRFSDEL